MAGSSALCLFNYARLYNGLSSGKRRPPDRTAEGLAAMPFPDSHHKIDITIQNLEKRQDLIHGLAVVRLVHEPVELSRRRAEPPIISLFDRGLAATRFCASRVSL